MPKTKLKYYNNLDGLRGIAAFSVLVFHFFLTDRLTSDIIHIEFVKKLTEILQHGVTLFFVLSGFVITRILLNTKSNRNYFSRFYKRRILRIFPLYYLYLLIHFFVFPTLTSGAPNLDFEKQLPVYFYLQNMGWLTKLNAIGPGHFWSLAVEEHFYLLWPLIVFIIPNNRIKSLTALLIIASIPIKAYFLNNGIDINYNTFSRYDSIMIGCLIAIIEKDSNYSIKKLNPKLITAILLSLLITGGAIYIFQEYFLFLKSITKHIILTTFFGLFIYWLLTENNSVPINRFLNNKTMQYFGKISYGLYVWHMMAISIIGLFAINNSIFNLILTIILTILMAHVSYFYYEKYFLKLK